MLFKPSWLSFIILTIFFALFSPQAKATLFSNAYVSFELPSNWECKLDGTEWVCISKYAKQSKEAIIILTAKEIGPTDSMTSYTNHLKTPRMLPDKAGKMTPSKVLHVKERLIGGHPWVDGMHMGSEIASYYTRYLASVKDRLAILVTFSAHKDHYTKYSSDFLKSIESIRVTVSKDILDTKPQAAMRGNNERAGVLTGLPEMEPISMPPEPKGNDLKTKLIALALLIGAIGFYLWKRKKN